MNKQRMSAPITLGLPTLMLVFLVLTLFTFATLSYLSANVQSKSIKKSTELLANYYDLSVEANTILADFDTDLNNLTKNLPIGADLQVILIKYVSAHSEIKYNNDTRQITFFVYSEPQKIEVKLQVFTTKQTKQWEIISYRLFIDNTQDYTQNGIQVWGGNQ